ncbi:MAG: hypothetical protein RBT80_13690 [Candidatus Vecturithrix sp.]|jgi:hypothetical protein|nr:hypothetical protein [Candidatus Vecturithrix sp.]
MKTIAIEYRFTLADGSQEIFPLELDAQTLELRVEWPGKLPLWTDLTFYQCPHCHVTPAQQPYCPLAANIANIVMRFDHLISYDRIHLDVITQERVISQDTTAQQGVSSLMGLVIANSGCPYTAFFKPMARFHLPLATVQETIFRAVSIYLISQYFLKQDGQPADFELQGLRKIYEDIHLVNRAMANRLRSISHSDLPANAVILLDLYTKAFPFTIEKILKNLRCLFAPFFKDMK